MGEGAPGEDFTSRLLSLPVLDDRRDDKNKGNRFSDCCAVRGGFAAVTTQARR